MRIGLKVRKLRELKNLTQEAIANELNLSQSAYSRYETHTANWDWAKLEVVSKVLGVSSNDVLTFDENKPLLNVINQNTFTAGSNPTIRNEIGTLAEQERIHYEARIATLNEMIVWLRQEIDRLRGE